MYVYERWRGVKQRDNWLFIRSSFDSVRRGTAVGDAGLATLEPCY